MDSNYYILTIILQSPIHDFIYFFYFFFMKKKCCWEWKLKELSLCEYKSKPVIENFHVPLVSVNDDFDLLPA
jgi:hypothetical protein